MKLLLVRPLLCIGLGLLCGLGAQHFTRRVQSAPIQPPLEPIHSAHELWMRSSEHDLCAVEYSSVVSALDQELDVAVRLQRSLHAGTFVYPNESGWPDAVAFHGLSTDMAPSVIEAKQRCVSEGRFRILNTARPFPLRAFGSRIEAWGQSAFLLWGPLVAPDRRVIFALDKTFDSDVFDSLDYLAKLHATQPQPKGR